MTPVDSKQRPAVASLNLWFGLLVIFLIGAAIRFAPLATSPFPLNDGGLFASMASDLVANGFRLPATASYNGAAIPFAYPPLGLYAVALISAVTGYDSVAVVRWMPPIVSVACIGAMYLMAAEILRSPWRGLIAAGAFALIPRTYVWLIVGGGVTRAVGFFFALLAIRQGVRLMRHQRPLDVLATAVLGGLTFLAHPQAALFLTVSLLVLFAFHVGGLRTWRSAGMLVAAGLGAVVVASPWLIAVLLTHGFEPIVSAGGTALDLGAGASALLGLAFTDAPVLDLITAFGVLGVFLRIARGQWMVPAWLIAAVVVDPRAGTTYATVPLALSVVPIIGELLQRMVPPQGGPGTLETVPIPTLVRGHRAASILLVLLLFASLRTSARTAVDPQAPLHGLQPDHLAAMDWVHRELDENAAVAIVTGLTWERDYVSEWFPVLTDRESLATVQGSEWTGQDAFLERLADYRQLQACTRQTATCIDDWSEARGIARPYVFLPKGSLADPFSAKDCCPALRETLSTSDGYVVAYDGPGATIYAPR